MAFRGDRCNAAVSAHDRTYNCTPASDGSTHYQSDGDDPEPSPSSGGVLSLVLALDPWRRTYP